MKTNLIMMSALALTLVGSGCATKKYVAKTMAPVEARVASTESKNAEQDTKLADQSKDIEALQAKASRADERITDLDGKATAAAQSADRANTAAASAQRTADTANTAAGNAANTANNAMTSATTANSAAAAAKTRADQVEVTVNNNIGRVVNLLLSETETVQFATDKSTLSDDAKEVLDAFAKKLAGKERFMIEIQGFTDKTGSADANTALSERRAEAVQRYLVIEHNIAPRNIETFGAGYTKPTGDDKTKEGRAANRRVEVRLFEPEVESLSAQK